MEQVLRQLQGCALRPESIECITPAIDRRKEVITMQSALRLQTTESVGKNTGKVQSLNLKTNGNCRPAQIPAIRAHVQTAECLSRASYMILKRKYTRCGTRQSAQRTISLRFASGTQHQPTASAGTECRNRYWIEERVTLGMIIW